MLEKLTPEQKHLSLMPLIENSIWELLLTLDSVARLSGTFDTWNHFRWFLGFILRNPY